MDLEVLLLLPHFLVFLSFVFSILPFLSYPLRYKFQAIAHGITAVGLYFLPKQYLKATVNGSFTPTHTFTQSFCASIHIGQTFLAYRSQDSGKQDQTVTFAAIVTSFISLVSKTFAAFHLSEKSTKGLSINDNFLMLHAANDGIWFLTELIRFYQNQKTDQEEYEEFLARRASANRMESVNPLSCALFFDAGLMFVYAMLHFAYPSHILKLIIKPEESIDSHHIMWCRLFGVLNLLPAIVSVNARYFSDALRVNWMASRLLSQCSVFLLNIYGHWVLSIYSANHITAFMISGFFSSFLFSVYHRINKLTYSPETYARRSHAHEE